MNPVEVQVCASEMENELENVKYNTGYVYDELWRVWERAFVGDECVHDNVSVESDRVWRMIKDIEEIQSSTNTLRHSIQELLHMTREEKIGGEKEDSSEDVTDVS